VQATDTSAIQRLIGKARFRIRSQWALEGATTGLILAAAGALATIFAMRIDAVGTGTGIGLLLGCGGIVVLGAIISALRPIDDETVARRIDRASNLADRLSTAIAFKRTMTGAPAAAEPGDDETEELMRAAIKDGVRAVPRADIVAAAPFTTPKDLRAAAAFVIVSALAAGLIIPRPDHTPRLGSADPDHARPGEVVRISGEHLMTGLAVAEARDAGHFVPTDGSVFLGPSDKARAMTIIDWTSTAITIRIPDDAPIGDTVLTAKIGTQVVGPLMFTVVDLKDERYHKENSVLLDPDERAYVERILEQLKMVAKRDNVPELEDFAKKIEQMLKDAEEGKITKEQLLEALQKAEEALAKNAEPDQAEVQKQMGEMGKELAKDKTTKELGEALQKNDLQKAKEELEKIADKLDPKEMQKEIEKLEKQLENKNLTEKEKAELQKKLDELKKEQEQAKKEQEALDKQKQELEKQMKDLEQQKKDLEKQLENKNLTEKEKAELQKKLDELKKQQQDAEKQKQDTEKQKQDAERKQDELEKQEQELKKQLENKQLSEQEKQELQKKIDDLKNQKPMSEKDKQDLQKKLDQVSKQMEKQDKDQQQKQDQQQQKVQDEIKRLEKKKQEAKSEKEKQDTERQLQKKKDELQKLNKDEQDKQDSAQRSALKRLQKDMEKAAENLEKPKKDPNESKDQQDKEEQEREKQASRNLKDAARETGRVDKDQRKQATQKKMSSQMDDLREAMRRAKQKGNKGPQDPFGKQGKNQDFAQRARGQKGSGQAWKPGQGQGQGKGQGQGQGQQPGGQGQGQGGDTWGTGHDDNLTGDPTGKNGKTKDDDLSGQQGKQGTSRRETILAAAQKGFASTSYKKVYADYQKIVEEVMRNEKMPSSYKYYVKRYFAKIHPSTGDATDEAVAPAPPASQDKKP
jgi:hypothetical protein